MRVLVGGVGYRYLRDNAVGLYITDQLSARATNGVEVEDLGYHPIGFIFNLQERQPYDRIVLVGAVKRGREAGAITAYRWDRALPSEREIQNRVSEAVTGTISLDNLLIITEAFGAFPEDVRVVEIEPADETWGDGLSPVVEAKLTEIEEAIWNSTKP